MTEVIVYSGHPCPYCERAKRATFTEIDVSADPVLREEMMTRAGGKRTVPQIFIAGKHIGGCDDLYALDRDGKLDALLAG